MFLYQCQQQQQLHAQVHKHYFNLLQQQLQASDIPIASAAVLPQSNPLAERWRV
jgi:hypothetical protein